MVKNDYFHSKIHIYVIVNIILNMFMKKKNAVLHHTCSGVRENILPPMVKETFGMEERLEQSTADSPMGLGSRSQSCSTLRA